MGLLGRPLERIVPSVLLKLRKYGDVLLVFELQLRSCGCIVVFDAAIPDLELVREARPFLRSALALPIALEHSRFLVDQKREARVFEAVVFVVPFVVEHERDHAEKQRRVRAGLDGHPFIALGGRRGVIGIDAPHLRAGFLGIHEPPVVDQVGLDDVGAQMNNGL